MNWFLEIINFQYGMITLLDYPNYILSDDYYNKLGVGHLSSMLFTLLTFFQAWKQFM